jgi:hypothetical protein
MLVEIGPVYPFNPVYGLYPTTTMKYSFYIDLPGNLLIRSQLIVHPHQQDPIVNEWKTEVKIQDNIKISTEMMTLIDVLLEDSPIYFISHWTFVIRAIESLKKASTYMYHCNNIVNLKNEYLMEQVDLLTAQNEQLKRRIRVYEPHVG